VRVALVVVGLLLSASARADTPPSLEDALANASQSRKPLVIEFFADWCKPCSYFDREVLPRADVAAALRNVEFVRYDIDASPGSEIADKLNVSGVPTFMVLDASGRVMTRRSGLSPTNPHRWFIDLLAHAGRATHSTEELEAAVTAQPNDVSAHLRLAQHYRAIGRIKDASEQFGWIVEHASAHRSMAAEAAAERDAMDDAEARLAAAVASAEKFVEAFPDSRLSSFRIVALAISGRVPRNRVNELVKAHLDAVALAQWPNALRAAILANAIGLARASVDARLQGAPNDPAIHLARAELLMFIGERPAAIREVDASCRPTGHELWCYLLRHAIDTQRESSPQIVRLHEFAKGFLDALERPEPRITDFGIETIGEVDEQFGNAVAAALRRAQVECEYASVVGGPTQIAIELRTAGRPMRVNVRSRDGADLDGCVRRVIGAVSLPPAPPAIDGHVHASLMFPSWRKAGTPAGLRHSGFMPQALMRLGDVENVSVRFNFMADGGGERSLRWMLGGTIEAGGGNTGGDPAYVARLMTGLGSFLGSPNTSVTLVAGIGISDLGTEAPRAMEIPSELRIRTKLGGAKLHGWVEGATIFFEDSRRPDDGHGPFGLDEWGLGLGVSFAVPATRRVFVGGVYESRAAGSSVMMLVGVPIGSFY